MKNRKFIVVTCVILNSFLLFAQEADSPLRVIPMAPETSAILQFGNVEMNLAKGIPIIDIPIYALKVDDVDIPISISYDASGIKVNDIASCVGLKWSLNTGGMVGRNIIGEADEMTADGYFNVSESLLTTCDIQVLENIYNSDKDISPDEYFYNFLGYSGSFIFKKNKEVVFGFDNNLKLTAPWDLSPNRFEIVDDKGTLYEFAQTQTTLIDITGSGAPISGRSGSGTTGWYLSKIKTSRNNEIKYYYGSTQLNYDYTSSYKMTRFYDGLSISGDLISIGSEFQVANIRIDSIVTPTVKVNFKYAEDLNLEVNKEKLDTIEVVDLFTHEIIRTISLHHSSYSGDSRLRLDDLKYHDRAENVVFEYNLDYSSGSLPAIGSYQRDVFGYYNSNGQYHMMPKLTNSSTGYTEADRSVDETKVLYGILNKITSPTGGYTEFLYEANKEEKAGDDLYAGGVRVSTITNKDSEGVTLTKKNYKYGEIGGTDTWTENDYSDFYNQAFPSGASLYYTNEYRYSSNRIPSPAFPVFNRIHGFYYKDVTVEEEGADGNHLTKYEFQSYPRFFTYIPHLYRTTYFEGSNENTKSRVEITNFIQIETDTIESYYTGESYLFQGYYQCVGGEEFCSAVINFCDVAYFYQPLVGTEDVLSKPLVSWKKTEHYENGLLELTELTDYSYNDYYLPKTISTHSSNISGSNRLSKTSVIYPIDITESGNLTSSNHSEDIIGISSMVSKNMLNFPIETYSTVDDKVVGGSNKSFHKETTFINVKQTHQLEIENPLEISVSDNSTKFTPAHIEWDGSDASLAIDNHYDVTKSTNIVYDDNGKIVEITKGTDISTGYIWGYRDELPIAKVLNASNEEIFHCNLEEEVEISGWPNNTELVETQKHSGRFAIKSTNTSSQSGEIFHGLLPKIEIDNAATKKYKLSAWVYSEGPPIDIHALFYDSNGAFIGGGYAETSETHRWVYVEKVLDVPSNVKEIMPRLDNDQWTSGSGDGVVYFDDIRFHPLDAEMTTYTYDPLIGVTSQSDPNSQPTHYKYDDFGRLQEVKDVDGNIIKQVEYNYINQ